jgi:uncharacterized membrane protein YjgN (DUF898 family)
MLVVIGAVGSAIATIGVLVAGRAGAKPDAATVIRVVVLFYLLAVPALFVLRAYWRSRVLNYTLGQSRLGPHHLGCALRARRLAFIYVTNLLGIVFTLGLFTPWAVIRAYRYQAESASVAFEGSSDDFVAAQTAAPGATAQELGELLDVDLGL